jgi:hypothetical protein
MWEHLHRADMASVIDNKSVISGGEYMEKSLNKSSINRTSTVLF